ncbi:MAG: FAD-dependent oxidoreductase [Lachnospiraceae bacterium]|nr:FAD-dependent oxidoreductase [Lachnospiraceae bacterium]HCJ07667.1 thioredoxin-disulfide reductase [Lachnospiraceae bacterium]
MVDIIIVGSGPAGMSAAVYGKRAGLSVLVIEKVYYGTGQVAESSHVDNYLGIPGINGYELGEKFRSHAEGLGVEFKDGEVIRFEKAEDRWYVHLKNGETLESKTVVYAAGAAHRHLGVPGEEELSGKGVSYCATCDGAFFKGKDVAVVGGGNTAMDDAIYLSDICNKVYLVHRRDVFRGDATTLTKLKETENIELVVPAKVQEVKGEQVVTALQLEDGRSLEVSGVFVAVGMQPATDLLQGVVLLDDNGYIIADETGKTSAAGFFAAGDVRTKELRQIITAVADGANAATSAEKYIRL